MMIMRAVIFQALVVLAGLSGVANAAFDTPNLYNLTGLGVQVSYATSSITGEARFSYSDTRQTLNFAGREIRELETEIGRQVSVTIESIPDLRTITFTLLIPAVNLQDTVARIQTTAIYTSHATSIGGPGLVAGQTQSYRSINLSGTASKVYYILPISGISGTILLSPTCPGPLVVGTACVAPFAGATVVILDANGNIVARTAADRAGVFSINVAPGDYIVQVPVNTLLPRCPNTKVNVPVNGYAAMEIVCDTGLR